MLNTESLIQMRANSDGYLLTYENKDKTLMRRVASRCAFWVAFALMILSGVYILKTANELAPNWRLSGELDALYRRAKGLDGHNISGTVTTKSLAPSDAIPSVLVIGDRRIAVGYTPSDWVKFCQSHPDIGWSPSGLSSIRVTDETSVSHSVMFLGTCYVGIRDNQKGRRICVVDLIERQYRSDYCDISFLSTIIECPGRLKKPKIIDVRILESPRIWLSVDKVPYEIRFGKPNADDSSHFIIPISINGEDDELEGTFDGSQITLTPLKHKIDAMGYIKTANIRY